MKAIKIEKTISEVKYQAADGEIFANEKDCIEYENTLKCIIRAKYNKLVVKHLKEYEIVPFGNEDYYVDVVKLKSKEDVETIVHLLNAYSQRSPEEIEKLMDNLDKIRKDKEDCLLLYAGSEYDGYWYSYLGSAKEFLEKAKNSIFDSSKKDVKLDLSKEEMLNKPIRIANPCKNYVDSIFRIPEYSKILSGNTY